MLDAGVLFSDPAFPRGCPSQHDVFAFGATAARALLGRTAFNCLRNVDQMLKTQREWVRIFEVSRI